MGPQHDHRVANRRIDDGRQFVEGVLDATDSGGYLLRWDDQALEVSLANGQPRLPLARRTSGSSATRRVSLSCAWTSQLEQAPGPASARGVADRVGEACQPTEPEQPTALRAMRRASEAVLVLGRLDRLLRVPCRIQA